LDARATIKDMILPFKILISPLKTFKQLAREPRSKGLISLSALILVVTAAALYASATKIDLDINGQPTSFLVTDAFNGWFASNFASSAVSILLYWLIFASGLALISKTFGGKEVSWRVMFLGLAYLLSVFIILYAVRAAMYLALPSLYFSNSSWPPMGEDQVNAALDLITKNWGPLYAYQFLTFFPLVVFAWLVMLGAIAVKTLREVSWAKAIAVSVIGFTVTLLLFGLP